jgi:uncharacterized membrane protein
VVFALLSVTPSFVPRGWEGQVILVTACALTGYAVGAALGWGRRVLKLPRLSRRVARGLWAAVAARVVVGLPAAAVVGRRWQLDQQQLLGMAPDVPWLSLAAPWSGLAAAAVLLVLCRGVRWVAVALVRPLVRFVPRPVAWVIAILVTGTVTWLLV